MKHLLSQRVKALAPSATIAMAEKARELKNQGKDVISLSLGEPDYDTPDVIKDAAKVALDQGYTKYTPVPGYADLRQAICDKIREDSHLDYQPSQIVVSNGAKQSIANVCLSILDPGDEVIILAPYWVSYAQIVQVAGGTPVSVLAGIEADYKVGADQLAEAITDKTRMVMFSSPCNPTGSVYSQAELEAIASVIKQHPDLLVLADEIYEYINYTDKHFSIAQVPSIHDRVIVVNGFSKAYSMTGWRLGYMAAHVDIAKACSKIQGQFTSGANAMSQRAGITALQEARQAAMDMKAAFAERKAVVKELLDAMPGIRANDPEGAFYFFPDATGVYGKSYGDRQINNSIDFCEYILDEALVAMVPGEAFGDDRCFRLSYAASMDELREAMRRLHTALDKLS